MGPKYLVIKKGEHGALLFSKTEVFFAPALPREEVFDPTGAGDSFAGGCVGYLEQTNDISFENMKSVSKGWRMNFPYLLDESQEIAKKYEAVCTPDIYVYGKERKLLYRGRIDDNWEKADQVRKRDLKQAIDCILGSKKVPEEQIPSMGCSIKWKVS